MPSSIGNIHGSEYCPVGFCLGRDASSVEFVAQKNPDPQLGFVFLTISMATIALVHGLIEGVNFAAAFGVLPLIALSIFGQLIYGNCLTKGAQMRRHLDLLSNHPCLTGIHRYCQFAVARQILFSIPAARHCPGGFGSIYAVIPARQPFFAGP